MSAEKRLPGQSNADFDRRPDPNADFLGTQSHAEGGAGGELPLLRRMTRVLFAWRDRRRAARP